MADSAAPTANGATDATSDSSYAPLTHTTPRGDSTAIGQSNLVPSLWVEHATTGLDESSPLLGPLANDSLAPIPAQPALSGRRSDIDGSASLQSKSSWYMFLLTVSMLGLQIAWSVETSSGSPYLLSLGISKEILAFVWIAGPLSGVLVQPYVGARSDRCTSRFGRRRPFMVGGAIATVISLLALAWAKELVGAVTTISGGGAAEAIKLGTIMFAVTMIYVLDFAINTIQAGIRAFIVDNAPTAQQESANAWATRLSGVGNVLGFLFGFMDLPKTFDIFGATQFKDLCMLASLVLVGTLTLSCIGVDETESVPSGPHYDRSQELSTNARQEIRGQPSPDFAARRTDNADRLLHDDRSQEFLASAGQETSTQPSPPFASRRTHYSARSLHKDHSQGLFTFFKELNQSVRHLPRQIRVVCYVQFFAWIGWFPFLFYITTYIGEIYSSPRFAANPNMTGEEIDQVWQEGTRVATGALFIFAITSFVASVVLPMLVTGSDTGVKDRSDRSNLRSEYSSAASRANCTAISFPSFTLRNAWLLSHLIFAILTWATFLVSTTTGATILVALIGIPWAMTLWAPFALIATEISRRNDNTTGVDDDDASETPQAGVVLGIHNVAIAAPQVIATLVSSAIFRALQKPRGSVGDESVAWVLRFGGLCALVAAWLTLRVKEESESEEAA